MMVILPDNKRSFKEEYLSYLEISKLMRSNTRRWRAMHNIDKILNFSLPLIKCDEELQDIHDIHIAKLRFFGLRYKVSLSCCLNLRPLDTYYSAVPTELASLSLTKRLSSTFDVYTIRDTKAYKLVSGYL